MSRPREDGQAMVLVYGNGRREAALAHAHDGGEAYMRPLLRKGVAYAKTHYESGNIVDVLQAEVEMRGLPYEACDAALRNDVRHVYYVLWRYDPGAGRKTYDVRALHLEDGEQVSGDMVPAFSARIPERAKSIM